MSSLQDVCFTSHLEECWLVHAFNVLGCAQQAANITKERLASYDRAIRSEPSFQPSQQQGLLTDLTNYLQTLMVRMTSLVTVNKSMHLQICMESLSCKCDVTESRCLGTHHISQDDAHKSEVT